MKNCFSVLFLFLAISQLGCISAQSNEAFADVEKIVLEDPDINYNYYLLLKPKSEKINGVVVLLPGFGQGPENIFLDTKIPRVAAENNLLTIAFAGRGRITADSVLRQKINVVLEDAISKNKLGKVPFFLGGFSAGGVVALRYAELCVEFPDQYPIQPKAVFMADAPVDLFHSWSLKEEDMKNNLSEVAVSEGEWINKLYQKNYGANPSENPETFRYLSPFSIDPAKGNNEQFLKDIAVRAYHDVDISWRLVHRNQTARFDNYIATSELINRLLLMGNSKAEFIQTFQTGYRRNGERHPHSWSIIDAEECVQWLLSLN